MKYYVPWTISACVILYVFLGMQLKIIAHVRCSGTHTLITNHNSLKQPEVWSAV